MSEYRHRPHLIEAQQFKGGISNAAVILKWINSNGGKGVWCGAIPPHKKLTLQIENPGLPETLRIQTKMGWQMVLIGDYVIRNAQGEFEQCRLEIFERDYESSLADVVDIATVANDLNNTA